jgi:hypothetical protein
LSAEPESVRLLLFEDNVIKQKVVAAILSNAAPQSGGTEYLLD